MTHPATPAPGDGAVRHALLKGLVLALQLLATNVAPLAEAADDIALLAARAEELAAAAWKASSDRTRDPAIAAALARDFNAFVTDAAALSARAARSAAASREVTATMQAHAATLASVSQEGATDIATLRIRLRPVALSLEELPKRMEESRTLAVDVASLGGRATELADLLSSHGGRTRSAAETAIAIYRGLRDLAEEAAQVGQTMLNDAARMRGAITGVVGHASRIASPSAAPSAAPPAGSAPNGAGVVPRTATAVDRLGKLVSQVGQQMRLAEQPRAAQPPATAQVWGKMPLSR